MTGLARLGDTQTLYRTERDALTAFLQGLSQTVTRLVGTFTTDLQSAPAAAQAPGERILARAQTAIANIADEMAYLNDSAQQTTSAWWRERVVNSRQIVGDVQSVSDDMIGLLTTGRVPSEERSRRNMLLMGGAALAVAAGGYYYYWKREKEAEEEQTRMLESGDLEDCGCGG